MVKKVLPVSESPSATPDRDVYESTNGRHSVAESTESNIDSHRTNVTHVRTHNEIRSTTATPEPIRETLTQEIVWVPEKRRGSYTIDKSDANNFTERYEENEIIPTNDGAIKVFGKGERSAYSTEERNSEVIQRDGYVQNVDTQIKKANAHEQNVKATEEVHVGTDVQNLENGGTCTTTTKTTVRKVGTSARHGGTTTTVVRTNATLTSRDIGVK